MTSVIKTIPLVKKEVVKEMYIQDLTEKYDVRIIELRRDYHTKKAALVRDYYINKLKSRVEAYTQFNQRGSVMARLSQRGREMMFLKAQFKLVDERLSKDYLKAVDDLTKEYDVLINEQDTLKSEEYLAQQQKLLADQL